MPADRLSVIPDGGVAQRSCRSGNQLFFCAAPKLDSKSRALAALTLRSTRRAFGMTIAREEAPL